MKRYTKEERIRAIELYIKYDRQASVTVRELGYPSSRGIRRWYDDYIKNDNAVVMKTHGKKKYTEEEIQIALDYYINHGRNLSRTIKALGYPSRNKLAEWRDEVMPEARQTRGSSIKCSQEQKKEAVIELCSRNDNVASIAQKYGVYRTTLYNWKKELLGEESPLKPERKKAKLQFSDVVSLESKVADLLNQVRELELEKDILEGTIEILKKDPGVNPDRLNNQEKALLIGALRHKYKLPVLLQQLNLSRSSYYYQESVLSSPDKYAELRIIIKQVFEENQERYGYRRIHGILSRKHIIVSVRIELGLLQPLY